MRFELFIADRYLRSKKRTGFISLITWISVAGVGLGTAVLIIVLSVMNGFEREVVRHVLGMTAHAQLIVPPGRDQNWENLLTQAQGSASVVGASPYARASGMVSRNGQTRGVVIEGVLDQSLPWVLVGIGVVIALVVEAFRIPSLPFAVGVYLPVATMVPVFLGGMVRRWMERRAATEEEAREGAAYFASMPYRKWVRVVETGEVPVTTFAGWIHEVIEGRGNEPIGTRIVEIPEDLSRTKLRDDASGFVAYVPVGSVARGEALVRSGRGGRESSQLSQGQLVDASVGVSDSACRSSRPFSAARWPSPSSP